MEKLVLIDGNSLINRAFYALPPLNNSDGVPTQAVYGFTTMLLKIIDQIFYNAFACLHKYFQATYLTNEHHH